MTREEKDQAVDGVLAHYQQLGATVVSDDDALCRLLQSLGLDTTDRDLGEYLCTFLVA